MTTVDPDDGNGYRKGSLQIFAAKQNEIELKRNFFRFEWKKDVLKNLKHRYLGSQ